MKEIQLNHQLDAAARVLQVVVPGDVLSTNADALREGLFEFVGPQSDPATCGWDTLALDLRAAQMVDSVGLNLVVALLRGLRERGQKLRVHVSSQLVHRSFVFTRLDRQLELIRG